MMEAIRRLRRAIGPDNLTMIWVACGVAAVLGLIFLLPDEGWPVLIAPAVMWVVVLVSFAFSVRRGSWLAWLKNPISMSLRVISLFLMLGGVTAAAWADFTGGNSFVGESVGAAGLLLMLLMDFVERHRI